MNNFNSLFGGNRYLENATSQVHSLRYYRFNMFNMENIFGNASYTKRRDAVKNYAQFFGVNQITSPFNSAFADESASVMGNYGRSFARFYKASVMASVNWSKFYNIQLGDYRTTESTTQMYTASASTTFKELPNFELGYTLTINAYTGERFYTERPFARMMRRLQAPIPRRAKASITSELRPSLSIKLGRMDAQTGSMPSAARTRCTAGRACTRSR
ncbi:MAG: hypothetical protein EOO82_03710 [Oxalobacteraceae bacterium]|nr:MAG: hypothetical protein EOO82_03710 [Oxalobacteraceae bacterium]